MSKISLAASDPAALDTRRMLRVIEIFRSIQGESSLAGWPTAFVRLAECNIRCTYCDTTYSFGKGEEWTEDAIVERVTGYGVRHVCVTGGEPMLQAEGAIALMRRLLDLGHVVSLETNGVIPLDGVPDGVVRVMDLKTPGGLGRSPGDPGFLKRFLHAPNLALLDRRDELKVVVTSHSDYVWARTFLREHRLFERVGAVLFSPSHGQVSPADLAAWMLDDQLPARLNLQLHKVIWGADATGV